MKRTIRLAGLLVAGAVALAACGGDDSSSSTTAAPGSSAGGGKLPAVESGTFRMGTEPWLGYGGWWIAQEKKFFEAHGVKVDIKSFDTDDAINAALVSGQLDGANIATHTALRLRAEGTAITAVGVLDQSNQADAILAKGSVASLKDLKGKKVAFEKGTTSDLLLNAAAAKEGMSIADFTVVETPAKDVSAALQSGSVDFGVTYEPYITPFLAANKDWKIVYPAANIPGIVSDVFVVRDEVKASKPGQILALLQALDDGIGYLASNSADGRAIISKAVGATPEDLATAFDGVKFYSVADMKSLIPGAFGTDTISLVYTSARQAGIITKDVADPKSIIDGSFVAKL